MFWQCGDLLMPFTSFRRYGDAVGLTACRFGRFLRLCRLERPLIGADQVMDLMDGDPHVRLPGAIG